MLITYVVSIYLFVINNWLTNGATLGSHFCILCVEKRVCCFATEDEGLLADDRLPVVAGDVVESDAVVVDSVQDAQAGLAALAVVGLGAPVSEISP